jgi:hypothetical protein
LCRANNCNNQTIANLIKKAVKDYYNLSAVYEALKVKIEEDLEEEHTTESQGETTTTSEGKSVNSTVITTTLNTNTTNNIAKLLDISIIMIIFNACLILFA